jgi:alcohol dehydrogenase
VDDKLKHAPFDFRMAGSLRMGLGARAVLADELACRQIRRAAVVTDPGLLKAGLVDEIGTHVGDTELCVFAEVEPDPPLACAQAAAEHARANNVQAVIGLGGGSSMDVAKVAAVMAAHTTPIEDLVGIDQVPGRGLPTLLVPTTSGTGSEVSPIAVMSDPEANLKKGVVSPHLYADVAIVDPELTVGMPPNVTAFTGLDALTHCIEAYTNKYATPFVDGVALEGIRLISRSLLPAVRDGADLQARYHMALGSLYGGMVLGTVNTGAAHALAYPLGGAFHVPHGVANSLLLPHVMRFNFPAVPGRFAAVAQAMGESVEGLSEMDAAEVAVNAVDRLSGEAGIVRRLRDLKIPETALPEMAAGAVLVTRLMRLNPRVVSVADALDIYRAAY